MDLSYELVCNYFHRKNYFNVYVSNLIGQINTHLPFPLIVL